MRSSAKLALASLLVLAASTLAQAETTELHFTCENTRSFKKFDASASFPGAKKFDVTATATYKASEDKYGGAPRDVDLSFRTAANGKEVMYGYLRETKVENLPEVLRSDDLRAAYTNGVDTLVILKSEDSSTKGYLYIQMAPNPTRTKDYERVKLKCLTHEVPVYESADEMPVG